MKKILKGIMIMSLGFLLVGCSVDSTCDCPDVSSISQEVVVDINTQISSLYKEHINETVTVFMYDGAYSLKSTGSGFVYMEDSQYAYILTNNHVVSGYTKSEVLFSNKARQVSSVVRTKSNEDIAILRIEKSENYSVATLGDSSFLERGETIFTIGSPLGIEYAGTITSGIVSGTNIEVDVDYASSTMYLIQIDAALNPGNSGGPLYNLDGEIVGINTLRIEETAAVNYVESFNYAIPINTAYNVATQLLAGGYTRPGVDMVFLTIPTISLNTKASYAISSDVYLGLYVTSVSTNGNAFAGGVRNGDIVTKINDVSILTSNDYYAELYKYNVGDTITLTVVDSNGLNEEVFSIML